MTVLRSISTWLPAWVTAGLSVTREMDGAVGFRYPALSLAAERTRVARLAEWLEADVRHAILTAALVDELVRPVGPGGMNA